MKRLLLVPALVLLCAARPISPPLPVPKPAVPAVAAIDAPRPVEVDLSGMPVSDVVSVVYRDVLRVPFAMSPEVYADRRPVTVFFRAPIERARSEFGRYLETLGYSVRSVGGLDHVRPTPVPVEPVIERSVYVYKPRYRSASYLAGVLRPAFPPGAFTANGSVAVPADGRLELGDTSPSSAASLMDSDADALVFNGTAEEIARLQTLVQEVDVPQGELMIRATVYEVQMGEAEGSAFQLAAGLLGGTLQIGINTGAIPGDSFIRFKSGSIDAVLSALSKDERFNIVTSPTVRARSGAETQFLAGQQVPVLGEVSYPGAIGGTPIQSVEYRDSGVIFRVRPVVRESSIDLDIEQELSNFVATTTGVNNSPTLIRRALASSLTVESGDIIILGGLTEDKQTTTTRRIPFLPIISEQVDSVTRTEILLVLQVLRVG